ncbi:hypothetical protein RB628_10570 [Streptomyces sp. ADMS]|uniref:hypothetical protein n=1 Tax=Streptomyces sp. ADMS TaxID=3071415 RepID=UPI00296E703E|nr:hypothetical protein [Streptomyces sp. ADMS]MDW4905770.1 hypothetical protein [Streptomyces sp. ADMS]
MTTFDGYVRRRPTPERSGRGFVVLGEAGSAATEADGITAGMVITELNRRDVPVVRFNPADISEDLAVSADGRLRDGVGDASRAARGGTLTGIRTRICTESSLYMGTVTAWRFLRS